MSVRLKSDVMGRRAAFEGRSCRQMALTVGVIVGVSCVSGGSAFASALFTDGSFTLPEGIIAAPGGGYLVSDGDNDAISLVPSGGGAPASSQATGFRTFGEVQLTSNYGANSGSYFAYGTDATSTSGVGALVGTSGIAAPTQVVNTPSGWFTTAAVAPTAYGSIAAGSVVLGNDPGGVGAASTTIEVLKPNVSGTTTFTTLNGISAFGVGFAPTSFGSHAGQMFVSDSATGNIYVVSSSGHTTLFATLPLPRGFSQPGLRQFAWAPAGFGAYGGDLFISVAAQNGGGGANGEIDVLNALGQTVALYDQGDGNVPLDPRGLDFVDDDTLLVANADPGVVEASPTDFLPANELLGVPEPGSLSLLATGLGSLAFAAARRRRNGACPR